MRDFKCKESFPYISRQEGLPLGISWTLRLDKALLWWLAAFQVKCSEVPGLIFVKEKQELSFCTLQVTVEGTGLVFQCWLLQQVQMRFSTFESQTFLSETQAQILDLSSRANVCAQCFSKDRYSLHQDVCGSVWTTIDFSQTMTMSCRDLYCCELPLRAPLEFFWSLVYLSSIYLFY